MMMIYILEYILKGFIEEFFKSIQVSILERYSHNRWMIEPLLQCSSPRETYEKEESVHEASMGILSCSYSFPIF